MLSITIHLNSHIIPFIISITVSCLYRSTYSKVDWKINYIKPIIFTNFFSFISRTIVDNNIIKFRGFSLNFFNCLFYTFALIISWYNYYFFHLLFLHNFTNYFALFYHSKAKKTRTNKVL